MGVLSHHVLIFCVFVCVLCFFVCVRVCVPRFSRLFSSACSTRGRGGGGGGGGKRWIDSIGHRGGFCEQLDGLFWPMDGA